MLSRWAAPILLCGIIWGAPSHAGIGSWFRNFFSSERERFRAGEDVLVSNEFFYEQCKLEEIRSADRLARLNCGPQSLTPSDSSWQDISGLDVRSISPVVESERLGDIDLKVGVQLFVEWVGGFEECAITELREGAVAKLKCASESSLFKNAWFDLSKLKVRLRHAPPTPRKG